jgi:Ser/Thr protein kinase RdoA (MazF antagonist)
MSLQSNKLITNILYLHLQNAQQGQSVQANWDEMVQDVSRTSTPVAVVTPYLQESVLHLDCTHDNCLVLNTLSLFIHQLHFHLL